MSLSSTERQTETETLLSPLGSKLIRKGRQECASQLVVSPRWHKQKKSLEQKTNKCSDYNFFSSQMENNVVSSQSSLLTILILIEQSHLSICSS